jgi:polyisoprenoid-binding protein YceI
MRIAATRTLALLILAFGVVAAARAEVRTYAVTPGKGQEIVFASKAPMESFEGRTDQASGTIAADFANLGAGCEVRIAVDLASMKTGIGMRDTHMRERHLETDKYPQAVFVGKRVAAATPGSLASGGTARLTVAGTFDLHGVSREMELPVDLALAADGTLTVQAHFTVLLSDHQIDRPKVVMLKLADEQKVSVSLTARAATEPAR